jgi:recombination protein RecT
VSAERRPTAAMVVATIGSKEFQQRIAASLPKNVDTDRFTRMTITALQNNPTLLEADKDSLYLAILKCAETGLAPDGKEAVLVVYNTKVGNNQWRKMVQFQPMVTGIIKKLGEVGVKCETETVHERDFFEYEAGDNPKITHRPAKLGEDRGKMIGAYAILRMQGIDTPYREVMDAAAIEVVRSQSKQPDSLMWTKFSGEGYRKTVLRRCAKRIPTKFDESVERTLEADNQTFDMPTGEAAGKTDAAPAADRPTDPTVVSEQAPKVLEQTQGERLEQGVSTEGVLVESENPAPPNAAEPTAPARPRALAAVVASQGDIEDIF